MGIKKSSILTKIISTNKNKNSKHCEMKIPSNKCDWIELAVLKFDEK